MHGYISRLSTLFHWYIFQCVCIFFISILCQYNIVWWLNFVVWSTVSRKPDSFSSTFLPQETRNFFKETFNQGWILGINFTLWWCINSFCIFLDLICLCSVKYFCLFWGMIYLFLDFVPWIIFIFVISLLFSDFRIMLTS